MLLEAVLYFFFLYYFNAAMVTNNGFLDREKIAQAKCGI